MESKNGTFVRGDRVTAPRTLSSGDGIGFGSVRMTFHLAADDRLTETVR